MTTYYIEEKGKIIFANNNKQLLLNNLLFRPDLCESDINETDRSIVMIDGQYIFEDEIPEPTIEEQNEEIRKQREARYVAETDNMKMDYDEAVARGEDSDAIKAEWLAKKDAIRADLPYVLEETDETEEDADTVMEAETPTEEAKDTE